MEQRKQPTKSNQLEIRSDRFLEKEHFKFKNPEEKQSIVHHMSTAQMMNSVVVTVVIVNDSVQS